MSRRPYVRPVSPTTWWLGHARFRNYMLREVTCVAIFLYTIMLVFGLWRLSQGEAAWSGFVGWLGSPLSIVFHLIVLALTVVHSVTWFNVTPKAMPISIREERVPGPTIIAAHYIGWGLASAVILIAAVAGA